jgi:hypothetical protein
MHLVAAVGRLVQKWERNGTKGETIHKHEIHKIGNKHKNKKTDIKRILKSINRAIIKWQREAKNETT